MPKRAKKILFATDYSESTPHAFTYAASLARDTGATLLVAHVSELEQQPVGELFDEDPQPSDEELAELRAIKPPDPRIACEHRLLYGEPAEQIVKLADQEHVEAIVIGTHDRSRLARLLGGSVSEKLLRTAHCPVITYRPPQKKQRPRLPARRTAKRRLTMTTRPFRRQPKRRRKRRPTPTCKGR